MAVLKKYFLFCTESHWPSLQPAPTLSTRSRIPLSRHYFFWAVEQIPRATPQGVRSGSSQQISVMRHFVVKLGKTSSSQPRTQSPISSPDGSRFPRSARLSQLFPFNGEVLAEAIVRTFERRKTAIPTVATCRERSLQNSLKMNRSSASGPRSIPKTGSTSRLSL